ncbi:MAG TPA: hypothetical protein PLK76_01660 [bacterium]|nr:hypothetical protein [bacterium]
MSERTKRFVWQALDSRSVRLILGLAVGNDNKKIKNQNQKVNPCSRKKIKPMLITIKKIL